MLAAAVDRLRRRWPDLRLRILTTDSGRLSGAVGGPGDGVRPVEIDGRDQWADCTFVSGSPQARPYRLRRVAQRAGADFKARRPTLFRSLIALRGIWHPADRAAGRFHDHVRWADLVLATGGGYFTDPFRRHANRVLDTLELARSLGKPTALLGQGLGPLSHASTRHRLAEAVRAAVLVTLRESAASGPLLEELNALGSNVICTGDDAVGPAAALGPADAACGDVLGLNVRAAKYSGIVGRADRLREAIAGAVAAMNAHVRCVPVSFHDKERDLDRTLELVPSNRLAAGGDVVEDTPEAVASVAGQCRAVVTGSYHAGVFALSRGVPVVGLVASDYYAWKFGGLAAQFGPGACTPLETTGPHLAARLTAAVTDAWNAGPDRRAAIYAAACRQAAACEAAYDQLLAEVSR
ncbi:Polysaccharide pyruvyl transferase [Alienimonas californiensis]|uniref:Polysaccharide pyruvyl transferase n=2 Tax=Alienimonas californiensis TaxID=2527989 RepID=A0A517P4A9_9PLAN|nr:Polysaccharide pyruvyl transferase [Alienimonas californiensis]